jgi:4-amino-4-deoxy-L-arabinose transferase-like glycosyltransferase
LKHVGNANVASHRRRWALAGLACALVLLARLPSLLHPWGIDDERVYALVANEIVHGGIPYLDAIERKPPLHFWTYAAVFRVAGPSNWLALHVAACLWTFGIMAGIYRLAGRQNRVAGVAAALAYGLFQSWGPSTTLAFNGEMAMNLPLVWAFVVALGGPRERGIARDALLAGALVAIAFLLKQPAAICILPVFGCLVARRQGVTGDALVRVAIPLCIGAALPLTIAAAILHAQGVLGEAIYWTIGNHDLPHVFWTRLALHTLAFGAACFPVLFAALTAIRQGLWTDDRLAYRTIAGWLAVSCIGAAAGGRFYPHYYIQMLPPLAVLAGPAFAHAWQRPAEAAWILRPRIAALFVIASAMLQGATLAQQRAPSPLAQYIRAHSAPEDRIFVWGHGPDIYLQSGRRPASRYILTFPLTGYVFGPDLPGLDTRNRIVPGAWAALASDLDRRPPLYIVDIETGPAARYPMARFPAFRTMVLQRYRPVTTLPQGTIYRRIARPGEHWAPMALSPPT